MLRPGRANGTIFTRAVSPSLGACELTHLGRVAIDLPRATAQHAAYEAALVDCGYDVRRLPPLPWTPDAVFVEDTAVLLDGRAVITRPGSPARLAETTSTRGALEAAGFEVTGLAAGRLDGGDVLRVGRRLFVGLSTRTDQAGAAALRVAAGQGCEVVTVKVTGCLHLKTAACWLGAEADGSATDGSGALLINSRWLESGRFANLPLIEVDSDEPFGANALRLGATVLLAASAPRTASALAARGYQVRLLDISELQKAEAGLTCMSLIG